MIRFRHQQMEAFNDQARLSFDARMRSHLQKFFPQHCAALGDEKIGLAITLAVQSAALYGIESEHGVCIFADMMFAFGHRFDQDGLHPWAMEVLRDPEIHDPAYRVERLHQAAIYALSNSSATNTAL